MKKILENKKVVLLAFDEKNEIEKEVMLMLPIWQTQSWIDSSAFRYLNNEKSGTLITENNFSFPFEMRVYFQGLETARFTDIESAKNWWKQEKRNYEKSEEFENKEVSKNAESKASVSEELEDPLKNTK